MICIKPRALGFGRFEKGRIEGRGVVVIITQKGRENRAS